MKSAGLTDIMIKSQICAGVKLQFKPNYYEYELKRPWPNPKYVFRKIPEGKEPNKPEQIRLAKSKVSSYNV